MKVKTAVFVLILAGLTACTTTPTQESPVPTGWEVVAVNDCHPLVERLTPYQHKGTRFFVDKMGHAVGRPLSEEEKMEVGRARPPHVPMSEIQFREYVQRHAAMFQAEKVYYTHSGGRLVQAITATVVQAKFGLARPDGVVWMEDNFFVQIIIGGKPCGVWEAEPK